MNDHIVDQHGQGWAYRVGSKNSLKLENGWYKHKCIHHFT